MFYGYSLIAMNYVDNKTKILLKCFLPNFTLAVMCTDKYTSAGKCHQFWVLWEVNRKYKISFLTLVWAKHSLAYVSILYCHLRFFAD